MIFLQKILRFKMMPASRQDRLLRYRSPVTGHPFSIAGFWETRMSYSQAGQERASISSAVISKAQPILFLVHQQCGLKTTTSTKKKIRTLPLLLQNRERNLDMC